MDLVTAWEAGCQRITRHGKRTSTQAILALIQDGTLGPDLLVGDVIGVDLAFRSRTGRDGPTHVVLGHDGDRPLGRSVLVTQC